MILPNLIWAQEGDSLVVENEYIDGIEDLITFKASLDWDVNALALFNNSQFLDIRPATELVTRFSIAYRFVKFSYSLAPDFLPENDNGKRKGSTINRNYSMDLYFNRLNQSFYYHRIKGHYLHNTGDFNPNWNSNTDPYIQFPDLVHLEFAGSTSFKSNPNFSFPAIFSFSEEQIKSAGTFLGSLRYQYYIVNDKTPLTGMNSSQKSNNILLELVPGYYHTFIIRNFKLSMGLEAGAGVVHTQLLTRLPSGHIQSKGTNVIYRLAGVGSVRYNSRRFFAGVFGSFSLDEYEQGDTNVYIIKDQFTFDFTVGFRLGTPKPIVVMFDYAEERRDKLLKKLGNIFKKKDKE